MGRASSTRPARKAVAAAVAAAFVWAGGNAHKAITSRFTYNRDVYPILVERCGACHSPGGPTPMSLLTYKDALPWAEAIREELAHERMPPSFADPAVAPGEPPLTARELDTLLVWATGGAPEGDSPLVASHAAAPVGWPLGRPDLVLPLAAYSMPEGQQEFVYEVAVPTGLSETTWVKAVDWRPGTAALVRSASIGLETPSGTGMLLDIWQPGRAARQVPEDSAFRLAAGSVLRVRVRYRRPWSLQGAVADQSQVGLYFTPEPAPGREIQSLRLTQAETGEPQSFAYSTASPGPARLIGWVPLLDRPYGSVTLSAGMPDGSSIEILRLGHPRPEWNRRYWLARPVDLPAGARLVVSATIDPYAPDIAARVTGPEAAMEFSVDYVSP